MIQKKSSNQRSQCLERNGKSGKKERNFIHRKDMDILSDDDITRMLIEALDIVNTLDEPKPVVVEEQKKWVVSVEDPDGYYNALYFDYFIERTAKEDFPYLISVTKEDSYKFTEKEKADAVAVLIDGTVEEVEASE